MNLQLNNFPQYQAGYSLLEVMIAVLVFSIGLIGVAALLLTSVSAATSSQARSVATVQAHALADTMRANVRGLDAANFGDNTASLDISTVAAGASCLGSAADCTPLEQANYDMAQWYTELQQALPGAQAVLCNDVSFDDGTPAAPACDGGNLKVIKIFWTNDDQRVSQELTGLGAGEHRFSTPLIPKAMLVNFP